MKRGAALLRVASLLLALCPVPSAGGEVLATVNGQPLTAAELSEESKGELLNVQRQAYEVRRNALEAAIAQRLLELEARRLAVSVDELIETHVTSRMEPITEDDARRFYEGIRSRRRPPFDEIRARIESQLRELRREEGRARFVAELRRQAQVNIHLRPPRVPITAEGPSRGSRDAHVVLIEFSDFQCPFCRQAQATVARIRGEYGDKVRHVFLDFPAEGIHPKARAAHEAARCADAQARFWEYHERLFSEPGKLDRADLLRHAAVLGLDVDAFKACMDSAEVKAAIVESIAAGRRAGVRGTPTFFVNGRAVAGAQSYEAFRALFEDELSRSGAPGSVGP